MEPKTYEILHFTVIHKSLSCNISKKIDSGNYTSFHSYYARFNKMLKTLAESLAAVHCQSDLRRQ